MLQMENDDFPSKPSRGKRWQRSRRARQRRKYTKMILQQKSIKTEQELLKILSKQLYSIVNKKQK